LFAPWHSVNAIPFDPAAMTPTGLAAAHLALLQARSAFAYHTAYGDRHGDP
jgi:hypothetical protein